MNSLVQPPIQAIKGRGGLGNPESRFLPICSSYEPSTQLLGELESIPAVRTEVRSEARAEQAGRLIARDRSPDIPFNQSINPYQGCEFGCIYCFARPGHTNLGLSPGLDFETRLAYKANAPKLLEAELAKPGYRCQPIVLGTSTDPYQPLEKELRITRQLLEVLQRNRHPFTLVTKSSLVLRDLDILAPMARQQLCSVRISVTTLDNELNRRLEPRTASPGARLKTIEALDRAGVPVGVLAAPVIPNINDQELEAILKASREAGARSAAYILVRLPREIKKMFQEWLQTHYPGRVRHVMSLIQQSREDKAGDARLDPQLTGTGYFADQIAQRFRIACIRQGLHQGEGGKLNCALFCNAAGAGQMTLF